jgi:hypothetical protein
MINLPMHRISRVLLPVLPVLLLCTLAVPARSGGWNVLPVLGYSSSSGVQLGGLLTNLHHHGGGARFFSLMAWYGTKGALVVEPDLRFIGPGGVWTLGGAYRKKIDSKWYGWGNGGDVDSLALFDMEQQVLYASLEKPLGRGFTVEVRAEVRHCVAYDFEEDSLFDTSPSHETGSLWTVGPEVRLTHSTFGRVRTTVEATGSWQAGDVSYGSAGGSASVILGIDGMTEAGLNLELTRHFETGSTPFPFLPSLGGGDGLRGFAGERFRGDWISLVNLELRRKIFVFQDREGNELGIGAVLFGDAGQVADGLEEFRWERFHLDAGLGLRMYAPGGAVLRADIGFSEEGFGVNTGFSELF